MGTDAAHQRTRRRVEQDSGYRIQCEAKRKHRFRRYKRQKGGIGSSTVCISVPQVYRYGGLVASPALLHLHSWGSGGSVTLVHIPSSHVLPIWLSCPICSVPMVPGMVINMTLTHPHSSSDLHSTFLGQTLPVWIDGSLQSFVNAMTGGGRRMRWDLIHLFTFHHHVIVIRAVDNDDQVRSKRA